MNILLACDNSSILNTILFIKRLIDIIFIVAPIVLVLLLTIDIAKNVISKDDGENKRNINIAIKRVVYCIVLFFVPLIIDGVMSYLDNYNVNFATCYEKATEENVQKYFDEEAKRDEEKQAEKDKEREANAAKIKNETTKDEETAKKVAKEAAKKVANAAKKTSEAISEANVSVPSQYVQAKKIAEAARTGPCASVSHARNCTLGDQSGKEVAFSKWRSSWDIILRPEDPVKANKAALCMEKAVKNNNIGYGREGNSSWSNLWRYLEKKNNWDPSIVTKKTSVSCCPLVGVCLKYAGYPVKNKNYSGLGCDCNSYSKKRSVKELGKFKEIKSRNLTDIRRGDILIKNCNHMAMAV